jgi:hypothetical protein
VEVREKATLPQEPFSLLLIGDKDNWEDRNRKWW